MLDAILAQVDKFELTGPVERLQSNLVAGIKHMPVRLTRSQASLIGRPAMSLVYAGLWQTASMLLPSGS